MSTSTPKKKKTREVTIDDETFVLAPLKMGQIEELIDAEQDGETPRSTRERTWLTIEASLRNAAPNKEGLTVADLKKRLDLDAFLELHRTALEVSGLRMGENAATES